MSTISTPAAALQLYIDGIANGDAAALEAAFHPDARMFGALGGQRVDIPITEMMAMVSAQPANVDGSFKATVRSIEEHGDVASATVDEESLERPPEVLKSGSNGTNQAPAKLSSTDPHTRQQDLI